jgi:hypothetical protein
MIKIKNKYLSYLLIAGFCYPTFLIITAPASLAVSMATTSGQKHPVSYQTITGTLWSGSAQHLTISTLQLADVSWSINLPPLLLGKLQYQVTSMDPSFNLNGTAGIGILSGIYAKDLQGSIAPKLVINLASIPLINASGNLMIDVEHLKIANSFPTVIQGTILWKDAGITSPVQISFGDIQLIPRMGDEKVIVDISTLNGTLQSKLKLEAILTITPQRDFQFQGNLTPGSEMDQGTVSMLSSIGQKNSDGSIVIRYSGKLPH